MSIEYLKEKLIEEKFFRRILLILFGVFLLAINYNMFLLPNHFVIGGTSGLAIVFESLFNWSSSVFLYVINFLLILLCYFTLGEAETKLAIIGSFFYPFMISFTKPLANYLLPYFNFDNLLILILVISLIQGLASGIIYKAGFNTGGSDILMKVVKKYFHIPEGKSLLFINTIIILMGGVVFGLTNVIYAVLILFLYSKLVDNILIGISNSKLFFIYTNEHKRVRNFVINEMKTGVTILKTEGGYSNKKGFMLMCVVPTKDYYMFKEMVKEIDSNAFFVIHDCYEVQGGKRNNLSFI